MIETFAIYIFIGLAIIYATCVVIALLAGWLVVPYPRGFVPPEDIMDEDAERRAMQLWLWPDEQERERQKVRAAIRAMRRKSPR